MRRALKQFFILCFVFNVTLFAQTVGDVAKQAHLANINALLIFTSQNGLNTGLFHFRNVGVDMEIYNLPFDYEFKSTTNLNYFLIGNVGYSRVFISGDIVIPPSSRLNYDNHLRTYTAGLGLGARYKFSKEMSFLGGMELIYSRSGASVKQPNDGLGNAIEDFFNKNYNDNLSYKLFLEAEYKAQLKYFNPYVKLGYKFFDTKSEFTFDDFSTFRSESNVFTSSLGFETNELYSYDKSYLTLEGYLNGNYLDGSVVESVKFTYYAKVGGVAYWYLGDKESWIKRLFVEMSTIHSDGLDGYNLGIGFSLNY